MESANYTVSWFVTGGVKRTIRGDPLLIDVEPDGNGFLLSEPLYGLWISSKSIDEGIEGIRTQLSMLWNAYVGCPESRLTEGAIELRERLLNLVDV